jgi:hypothetical protein
MVNSRQVLVFAPWQELRGVVIQLSPSVRPSSGRLSETGVVLNLTGNGRVRRRDFIKAIARIER